MSAVDVLVVLDKAKRVAALCGPLARLAQHPASNSLEDQAFNLLGEIGDARTAVAELIDTGREFFDAQANLDNHEAAGINADSYSTLMRHRNWARAEFEDALARVGGATQPLTEAQQAREVNERG
jgi:hypothetical protein